MYVASVIFLKTDDSHFDVEYYKNKGIKLAREVLGDYIQDASFEIGISDYEAGSHPPYHAISRFFYKSLDDVYESLKHTQKLSEDKPNYTNAEAMMLISEVL